MLLAFDTATPAVTVALHDGERAELLDPEPMYLRRPDVAAPGARKPVS